MRNGRWHCREREGGRQQGEEVKKVGKRHKKNYRTERRRQVEKVKSLRTITWTHLARGWRRREEEEREKGKEGGRKGGR